MFHLAPVGLTSTHRVDKCDHYNIQHNVAVAVRDICDTSYRQKIAYNLLHPDTKALLKSLDAFFAHGLNRLDKCYWCFVREFIPLSEQEEIRLRWKCNRTRALSVAWLKDSLNKCTLYFQILSFRNAASIKAKWYQKNACLRNQKVLAKICELVEKLEFVEFDIEAPYELRTEDVPIAMPIAMPIAITGSGANNDSVASSSSNDYFASGSVDVVVCRGHHKPSAEPRVRRDRVGGAFSAANSFVELSENNAHLSALTENLAEVDLSSTAIDSDEQLVSTATDQNFIIDELVESYRKRVNGYLQSKDEEQSTSSRHLDLSRANNAGLVTEVVDDDALELTFEMRKFDVTRENYQNRENDPAAERMTLVERETPENEDTAKISSADKKAPETGGSAAELNVGERVGSATVGNVAESSDLSEFEDADEFVTGEIPLDSGDIVQLAMEVFRGDGERFQRLFQVYVGHCAGQPTLRYLAVTDQYLYLLSTANSSCSANDASDAIDFRASSFGDAAGAPSVAASSFVVGSVGGFRSVVGNPGDYRCGIMKYIAHTTLKLTDVDCLTLGIDAQVLCVHMKKLKLLTTNESRTSLNGSAGDVALARDGATSDQLRVFAVETGCRELTKLIIRTVQQVAGNSLGARLPVFTRSTQLSIIAKRLLRHELGLSNVEVLHHSLVYWMEEVIASTGGKSDRSSAAARSSEPVNQSLEGYLHVRGVNTKSWVKRAGEWQYSYFVFKGFMLYQFSDSTCKFAQKSYNVREKVTQVFEADLKSDGELGFQMELDENCAECTHGGVKALQFRCLSRSDVNKWIQSISLALSVSEMSGGLPIASMLFITADNLILAQEGANCIVDGFMRALNNVARRDVRRVYVVRTEFHNVAVLERNGSTEAEDGGGRVVFEWIFLRDERELKRLLLTLDARWSVRVEDDEDRAADPATFNRIFNECAKMSSGDLWTTMCGR